VRDIAVASLSLREVRISDGTGTLPGEKLQVLGFDGRIEMVPLRPMRELCGVLGPIDTTVERDGDRL